MEDFQKELQVASGLVLCPKCKKGHLYPVVTASVSIEPKSLFQESGSIRDYQCDICGYKQKGAKQRHNVYVKNKASASVKKTRKPTLKLKLKPKLKSKSKSKSKSKTKTKTKTKTKKKRERR